MKVQNSEGCKIQNLRKCIACPVAHLFIKVYYNMNVKPFINTKSYIDKKRYIYENQIKELEQIINAKLEQTFINNLGKSTYENNIPKNLNNTCIENISNIIYFIKKLINDCDEREPIIHEFNKKSVSVLFSMQKFLIKNGERLNSIITDEESKWTQGYVKNINVDETYEKFQYILETYCAPESKVEYEYCSPQYNVIQNFSSKNKGKLKDCQRNKLEVEDDIALRLSNLSNYHEKIAVLYLKRAPKFTGHIINTLMKRADLTNTEVAYLLYGKEAKNNVQGLHNTDNKTNKLSQEEIKKLSKIFLVSEEVLSCGIGKIYGKWKDFLNASTNKKFQDEFLTNEDKNSLNNLENQKQNKPSTKTKQRMIETVKNQIDLSDIDFKNLISEIPEFFEEEDICIYTSNESGETYNDYNVMYQYLIDRQAFDLLLSIFEEQEREIEHQLFEKPTTEQEQQKNRKIFLDIINNS